MRNGRKAFIVAYTAAVRGYEKAYKALKASEVAPFTDVVAYAIIVSVLTMVVRFVLIVVCVVLYLLCPFRCCKRGKCCKCCKRGKCCKCCKC